ncbi:MAG: hypothetical protein A3J75_07550 [Acidobacteria bacterium RBG_16_68_9]|nr:MAG: hypothetical protein A3J75_07550 [Acidobacteria bacterium RBG_16_68_9]
MAAGLVVVPALAVTCYPPAWIGIFTEDADIRAVGAQYLQTIGPSYLFVVASMVLGMSFQGFGRATVPLAVMTTRAAIVVTLVLVLTQVYGHGVQSVVFVIATGNVGAAVALALMFRRTLGAFARRSADAPLRSTPQIPET